MTIYNLDVLLFPFGTSLLFHVQFYCCFLTGRKTSWGFSRGRSGGLVCLSLEEFSTVYFGPHSQRLWHSQYSRNRCFSRTLLLFQWSSRCWQFDLWLSAFSKSHLNIWKFMVHVLLKPGLEDFEHYFARMWDECNCAVVWTFFGVVDLQFCLV